MKSDESIEFRVDLTEQVFEGVKREGCEPIIGFLEVLKAMVVESEFEAVDRVLAEAKNKKH